MTATKTAENSKLVFKEMCKFFIFFYNLNKKQYKILVLYIDLFYFLYEHIFNVICHFSDRWKYLIVALNLDYNKLFISSVDNNQIPFFSWNFKTDIGFCLFFLWVYLKPLIYFMLFTNYYDFIWCCRFMWLFWLFNSKNIRPVIHFRKSF